MGRTAEGLNAWADGAAERRQLLSEETQRQLDAIIDLVECHTGVDLHCYRQGAIVRRTANRLRLAGCSDHAEYIRLLERDPEEASRLLSYVTIKWSSFFRDPQQLDRLCGQALPDLLSRFGGHLAVWSAGCGRGEEPYSLAIAFAEAAGGPLSETTIYATDVDESALAAAGERVYPRSALENVPNSLLDRYFTPQLSRRGPHFRLCDEVTLQTRFLRHDILSGCLLPQAPAFHLVLCRNLLIYFQRQVQHRIFDLLAASLVSGGYLCLGEAEQLPESYCPPFEVLDRKLRIYRKR